MVIKPRNPFQPLTVNEIKITIAAIPQIKRGVVMEFDNGFIVVILFKWWAVFSRTSKAEILEALHKFFYEAAPVNCTDIDVVEI